MNYRRVCSILKKSLAIGKLNYDKVCFLLIEINNCYNFNSYRCLFSTLLGKMYLVKTLLYWCNYARLLRLPCATHNKPRIPSFSIKNQTLKDRWFTFCSGSVLVRQSNNVNNLLWLIQYFLTYT